MAHDWVPEDPSARAEGGEEEVRAYLTAWRPAWVDSSGGVFPVARAPVGAAPGEWTFAQPMRATSAPGTLFSVHFLFYASPGRPT